MDLDVSILAETVDVGLVVPLERVFAGVLAELILHGLECRNFGGETCFDLDDVPAGLGGDGSEDGACGSRRRLPEACCS